jgi:hypothetical protein
MTPMLHSNRFGENWSGKRCLARTRAGGQCQKPAWRAADGGRRCNLHGGLSLRGKDHPGYKSGEHTQAAIALRRSKAASARRSLRRVALASEIGSLLGMFDEPKKRHRRVAERLVLLEKELRSLLDPPPQ